MRTLLLRLARITVLLVFYVSMSAVSSASSEINVESEIGAKMDNDGSAGYLICFREKPKMMQATSMNRKARGEFVVSALQQAAEHAQGNVQAYLDARNVQYKSFWIDNIIVVEKSDKKVLDGLMQFSEIESIKARRTIQLHEPVERKAASPNNPSNMPMGSEPNIAHVHADQVWDMGYNGNGIVVANIDTGVRYTHQALVNQYRGNLGDGTFNHNYNWYDPYGAYTAPTDSDGHGTFTMGTAVGYDGGSNQIGMAPGAKWMACRGCNIYGCNDAALLSCGQFIAAPTDINGNNPDPSKRPHVVNNSWGGCETSYDNWYRTVVDNWQAAGIYPVFSNGNSSNCGYSSPPPCNTVGNPARYGNVTGVGSTGQSSGEYATHSNRGPTDNLDTINLNDYASIKPQVAAPGVNIRSSVPTSDSSYEGGWIGTSMSAPHVTGLVALMLQAAPCLSYAQAETIIEQTAVLNTTGLPAACSGEGPGRLPNQATGWGEIDALAAVKMALSMCGPSGTLTGMVRDAATTNPISGATVSAANRSATTNSSGQYMFINLPAGTYNVTAIAFGYEKATAYDVGITDDNTTTQNFDLVPKPFVTVSGTVTDGSGAGWPLYASLLVQSTGFSDMVMTDPVTGQYSLELLGNTDFAFMISAGWYATQTVKVRTETSALTKDFSLTVSSCNAPGYSLIFESFHENFDNRTMPSNLPVGWAQADIVGTAGAWAINAGTAHPSGGGTKSSPNLVYFNSYSTDAGEQTLLYRTTGFDLSGVSSANISFWMYHDLDYPTSDDRVQVQVSEDGGSVWENVGPAVSRYDGSQGWKQHSVDLSAYTGLGMNDVRITFLGISEYGNDIHIDDVILGAECDIVPGGLVAGRVSDANTGIAISGVTVASEASSVICDSKGTYVLFASPGTHDVTATPDLGTGYGAVTQSVSVDNGTVSELDFSLPAGKLSVNPDNLTVEIDGGMSTTRSIALHNSGGITTSFEIQEQFASVPGSTFGIVGKTYPPMVEKSESITDTNRNVVNGTKDKKHAQKAAANLQTGKESNGWGSGRVMPAAARYRAGSTCDGNCQKIYVFGGGTDYGYMNDVLVYNTVTDTWTIGLTPIPHAGQNWQAVYINDKYYLAGGYDIEHNNWLQIYDPAANSWSTGANMPMANSPMAASLNGLLYVFGGMTSPTTVAKYDPETNLWTTGLASMPTARGYGRAIAIRDYIYVVGGTSEFNVTGAFERYDPAKDTWVSGASLNQARADMSLFAAGEYLYASGGITSWSSWAGVNTVERYRITSFPWGVWETMPAAPTAFGAAAYACASDKMWSIGGKDADRHDTTTNRYQDEGLECVCKGADVPWLSENPISGNVAISSTQNVDILFDSTGLAAGTYYARLKIKNAPYSPLTVPVSMHVLTSNIITTTTTIGCGWNFMNSGITTNSALYGVWGSSGSDVFAVGMGMIGGTGTGIILHYDGTTWNSMMSTAYQVDGVWGSSGDDVFAVGVGTILHYNGTTWTNMTSGTTGPLRGVWGSSGSDVFAVGDTGTILHYNGMTWSSMNSGTIRNLNKVWGSSSSDVYAVCYGYDGRILHYNGATWDNMTIDTTSLLFDIWGSSGSDIFAVGSYPGIILHYDGMAWSSMTSGTTQDLFGVWGSSGSDVFAVGEGVVHYDGTTWSPMLNGQSLPLKGVWGSSGSEVFAVGDYGRILLYKNCGSTTTTTSQSTTTMESSSTTTIANSSTTTVGNSSTTTVGNSSTTTIGDSSTTTVGNSSTTTILTTTTAPAGLTTTTTTVPACIDKDGDGYGDNCTAGPDCDDTNALVHDNCTTSCTLKVWPKTISKIMGSIHPVQLLNRARPHGTNTEDFGILLSSRIDSSKTDSGVLLAFLNLLRYAGPFKAIVILGEEDTVFAKADRLQWSSESIKTLLCFRFGTRVMVALVLINPFTAEAGEYEFIVGDCSGSITLESP